MKAASMECAPANCNNVIAVTAHAINGENASYSNIDPAGGSQVSVSAAGGGSLDSALPR
jgi:serine protease